MAISLKATGAWTEFTSTSAAPTIPGSPAAGDRMFAWVTWKNVSATCSPPAGWTELREYADGAVASGNGTGSMTIACYYRDWVSGDGTPTFTLSAAAGVGAHVMQLWQKGGTESWDTPSASTGAIPGVVAATGWGSVVGVSVPDGSVVMNGIGIRDDSATCTRTTGSINGWKNVLTDDFTRANSTTSAGPNWTNVQGTCGVSSNQFYGVTGTSPNNAQHGTALSGDDQRAKAVISNLSATPADQPEIFLGSTAANQVYAMFTLTGFFGIYTSTNWNLGTGQLNRVAGSLIANGQTISIERVGNIYTARDDGELNCFWNDSGAAMPKGSTFRNLALGMYHPGAGTAGRWDDWVAQEPITWNGNYVESPATHFSTTTGNDMAADLGHRFVTTGGASVDFTGEATLSAAETGAALFVVQSVSVSGASGTSAATLQALLKAAAGGQEQSGSSAASATPLTAAAAGQMEPSGTAAASMKGPTAAASGAQTQTGTSAPKLRELIASAVGAQAQTGTSATALQKMIAAAAGAEAPSGVSAASVRPLTAAAAGAQEQSGASAASLPPVTASATGAMAPSGTGAASVAPLTAAASGAQAQQGASSAALAALTAAASGAQILTGISAVTVPKLTASAVGAQAFVGAAAAVLQALSAAASGAQAQSGAGAAALRALTAAASGSQAQLGAAAAVLQALTASAAGQMPFSGASAVSLRVLTAAAGGEALGFGTASATLAHLVAAASGAQEQSGTSAVVLVAISAAASGGLTANIAVAALAPLQAAGAGAQPFTGVAAAVLAHLVAAAVGGQPQAGSSQVIVMALLAAGQGMAMNSEFSTVRMLVVEAEDRTLYVAEDQRTLEVAAVDRTLEVAAEDRTVEWVAEVRAVEVPTEDREFIVSGMHEELPVAEEDRTVVVEEDDRELVVEAEDRTLYVEAEDRTVEWPASPVLVVDP